MDFLDSLVAYKMRNPFFIQIELEVIARILIENLSSSNRFLMYPGNKACIFVIK